MDDVNRGRIRERKGVCGGCGSPLRKVGPVEDPGRDDAFECTDEDCGYREHRLYGDRYYEAVNKRAEERLEADVGVHQPEAVGWIAANQLRR